MTGRLELAVDEQFQRTEWRLQRIGWGIWLTVLVAAAIGLFGPGWIGSREIRSEDGKIVVRYERFLNYHKPTRIDVVAENHAPELRVDIDNSLLDSVQMLHITPEPTRSTVTSSGITYQFEVDKGAANAKVTFDLEYDRYGAVVGKVRVSGRDAVQLNQFVYP